MRTAIAFICLLLVGSCMSGEPEVSPTQFDRDFFQLTTTEQLSRFQGYDMKTQFELLIVGNQVVHPPATYLIKALAGRGASIVPLLQIELADAKREATVRDIVAVLAEMKRMGTYDTNSNANLMTLAEERSDSMRGQWKPMTHQMVEELRH